MKHIEGSIYFGSISIFSCTKRKQDTRHDRRLKTCACLRPGGDLANNTTNKSSRESIACSSSSISSNPYQDPVIFALSKGSACPDQIFTMFRFTENTPRSSLTLDAKNTRHVEKFVMVVLSNRGSWRGIRFKRR